MPREMPSPAPLTLDLEELLEATSDVVARFRRGQLEAVSAALDGGLLLAEAKSRLQHGDWLPWLERVGLNGRTAQRWMQLASLDLTAEEIVERGGIRAVLAQPRAGGALPADPRQLQEALEAVEREIARAKASYYSALTRRQGALRALTKSVTVTHVDEGEDAAGK